MDPMNPIAPSSPSAAPTSFFARIARLSDGPARPLASALARRLDGFRRDLRVVADGLAGKHPPPVLIRPRRQGAVALTSLQPRLLRVVEVIRETDDAVTLVFADPSGASFSFEAGQFLTLILAPDGDGKMVRRAYSASSCSLDGATIAITSKRVAGGKVSNYLNDRVEPGMLIQALGPSGNFTPMLRPERQRHLVLIGGGSGITPLMSIVQSALRLETGTRLTLLYGNRRHTDIIFARRLAELEHESGERLRVRHVLSEPPADWSGGVGLLDEKTVGRELDALLQAQDTGESTEYYLCGPEPMMAAARAALLGRGVLAGRIHEERFATLRETETAAQLPKTPQLFELRLPGQSRALSVKPGETLLDAGLAAGAAMPFSCAVGGCGACKGRIVSGEVTMPEPNCLTASERQDGYVLCCIARPRTAVTVELGR